MRDTVRLADRAEPSQGEILYIHRLFKKIGVPALPHQLVLDLGCGKALTTGYLASQGAKVMGLDLALDKSWRGLGTRLHLLLGDGHCLPFRDESLDVVMVKDMLHHAKMPGQVLLEVKRVLRSGGQAFIIEPNRYNPILYFHLTKLCRHEHFRRGHFRGLVEKHFPSSRILSFEAHVFPIRSGRLVRILQRLEDALERVRLLQPLLAYNVVVATK